MASESGTPRPGLLTLEQLRVAIGEGEIDTVVLAFTDMQGRLAGKRLSAEFFLDEVAEHYSEGCNYLLAVDVDMNTVDGYAMSSWERGYGDFVLVPDMSTLRHVPWQEATAMVIADLTWLDGTPVAASPRQILRAQTDAAGRARPGRAGRDRAGVHRLPGYLRGGGGQGVPGPDPGQHLQRRLLDPGHGADRAAAAPDPQRHDRGRVVRGIGQGRVQPRPARDRVPVRRGGDHLRQPLDLQDRVQGDRRPGRHEPDVHGQAERPRGQLLPHPPVGALGGGRFPGDGLRFRRVRHVPAWASTSWPGCWTRCAS